MIREPVEIRRATATQAAEAGRAAGRPPIDARGLARLARRGGAVGLAHFRRTTKESKADPALVDVADRAIEQLIREEVARHAPTLAVLGKDDPSAAGASAGWALAIDPIDGPDAYVAGLPTWSVSLGLLHRGLPASGIVYLPAFDDLYVASGGVLRWNGVAVPRGGVLPQHAGFVLAYSEFHRRHLLRFGGTTRKMRALGSTAYHMSLVARGAAEAAIIGRVHLWQIAGGLALLEAAGGELVYMRTGAAVDPAALLGGEVSRDFMLAARSGARQRVLEAIRRR